MSADTSIPPLLPCPFCGGTDLEVVGDVRWSYVACGRTRKAGTGCGSTSSAYASPVGARKAWNRRAVAMPAASPSVEAAGKHLTAVLAQHTIDLSLPQVREVWDALNAFATATVEAARASAHDVDAIARVLYILNHTESREKQCVKFWEREEAGAPTREHWRYEAERFRRLLTSSGTSTPEAPHA